MKMFLLGILAWSAFCAVCYTLSTDDDRVALVTGGPVIWAVVLVVGIARTIHRKYRHATVKALMKDNDGNIYWCESGDMDTLWGYSSLRPANVKGVTNSRYAPRKIWKSYPKVPDDILQKAKTDIELSTKEW